MTAVRHIVYFILFHFVALYSNKVYAQWVQVFNSDNGGNIHSIAMSDNILFAGSDSGVYRSTDSGATWALSDLKTTITVLFNKGNTIFAGTQGEGIFLSTTYGENWEAGNEGLSNKSIHSFAVNGNTLFAGADSGLYFSTNDGDTWASTGITDNYVSALIVNGNTLFAGLDVWVSAFTNGVRKAGAYDMGTYFSGDNGINWTFTGLYHAPLSFALNGNQLFAGTYGSGVFHSGDNGKNWNSASSGLASGYIHALDVKGNSIFAGTDSGIFISTNNGASWNPVDAGLAGSSGKSVRALMVIGNDLYAGIAGSGLWKRPISEMTLTEIKRAGSEIPCHAALNQNFPNPFNPSTTISFSMPFQGFVSLKIFDLSGREITTLVSEMVNPGTHSYRWNASDHASGIYFYRLQSDKFQNTKTFLLLK